jgi:hypothetical protein
MIIKYGDTRSMRKGGDYNGAHILPGFPLSTGNIFRGHTTRGGVAKTEKK